MKVETITKLMAQLGKVEQEIETARDKRPHDRKIADNLREAQRAARMAIQALGRLLA